MLRLLLLTGRMAVVVVAVALAAVPAPAQEIPFRASGVDSGGAFKGDTITGTTSGQAMPGGTFTGEYTGKWRGRVVIGVETWTFGSGDTLTWAWEVTRRTGTGQYVVIGGTGRFENATGSAIWTRSEIQEDGTFQFEIEGTLSLK